MSATSDFDAEAGKLMRAARIAAGMTQEELARAIGLTRVSVCNIESGVQGRISLGTVVACARATEVDLLCLVPGTHDARALLAAHSKRRAGERNKKLASLRRQIAKLEAQR